MKSIKRYRKMGNCYCIQMRVAPQHSGHRHPKSWKMFCKPMALMMIVMSCNHQLEIVHLVYWTGMKFQPVMRMRLRMICVYSYVIPQKKNLDSLFGRPQARDYCPSKLHSPIYAKLGDVQHPLQSENYRPLVTLQPPLYTEQGNTPDASLYYDECNNWQSAFKNNISTNEFDMPVPQPQTEVNLESAACRFQPQDCTLQPPIYTNFGEALHNIECNELQYSSWDNDCSLTKFMNTNYLDCYSYDQAAQTHFQHSNLQSHWEGSTMGIME